jgi:hypothetical protein
MARASEFHGLAIFGIGANDVIGDVVKLQSLFVLVVNSVNLEDDVSLNVLRSGLVELSEFD